MSSHYTPNQSNPAPAAPLHRSHALFNPVVAAMNPSAAAAPAGTFLPGTKVQVGNHRVIIEKYLSEGGFAHVYVVRLPQPIDGTEQAVLKRVAVPDKNALASMRTEVETMKKLNGHRHIVKYIDSHASQLKGGGYEVFLLMEYCAGGGLIDFMNTRLQNRLTEPEILKIFSDVAEGVACMHYLKPPLLHRDLKVENVLISRSGTSLLYKLCDFGSAAHPRSAATSAAEGRLIEDDVQRHTTLQYRSPEMIDVYRKQPIDEKSDIWALGVLLYKLCYYTTPFEEVGQMAILNASFKYPPYPAFSDRLKLLIASMLKEDPQKRPNIYEVLRDACKMQGKEVPIHNIYTGRTTSETRPRKESPKSPAETVRMGAVFSPPIQETQIIPEIAPMRRGRPTRPTSQHNSAQPSPAPFRTASTDPFAALDGAAAKTAKRGPADELANRFPTLDQFNILHEKGGKFDFEPAVTEAKTEKDELARRLTNALADEAFVKRPSAETEPTREAAPTQRPKTSPLEARSKLSPNLRGEETTERAPLHQPAPKRPAMVSTGTMTSSSPTLAPSDLKLGDRPIYRFPQSESNRRPSSQPRFDEREGKASGQADVPPRAVVYGRKEPSPRTSAERISNLTSSARPSLDSFRPSYLGVREPVERSKSANANANAKARPTSVHASGKYDLPRQSESARSSIDLPSTAGYDAGAPLQHARTDTEFERSNISSDVDYLRAREEEELNRKREKRYSGGSKHAKRSSLSTLSLQGTKSILAGRFGDAFRRFENNGDAKIRTPSPDEQQDPLRTITAEPEVMDRGEEAVDGERDNDVSPEMRRELERRRLSQEEKRVANAAAEYRRRVAERGDGGWKGGHDAPRSSAIQNKMQSLIQDTNKPPPPKTASGYGRYTDSETGGSVNASGTSGRAEQFSPPTASSSASRSLPTIHHETQSRSALTASGVSKPQNSGAAGATAQPLSARSAASRPAAPPKPKNLRAGGPTTAADSPARPSSRDTLERDHNAAAGDIDAPASPSEDWVTNFSRRYPSLSGLEMVETEIQLPKMSNLRTKEV